MTPSTRTPTKAQVQVLYAVKNPTALGGDGDGTGTMRIHNWRAQMAVAKAEAEGAEPAKISQPDTFKQLNACCKNEWLEMITDTKPFDNGGSHLSWALTSAGSEALVRGMAAIEKAKQKETPVAPTTTDAPPASTPAWGAGAAPAADEATEPASELDAVNTDLEDLDADAAAAADADEPTAEEDAGEAEIVDDEEEAETVERHVNEGSNQLTMLVVPKGSKLKPKQFTLQIRARQQEFGTTREYLAGERIEFSGVIEIDEMRTKRKKDGTWVKVALGKVAEIDLLDKAADE